MAEMVINASAGVSVLPVPRNIEENVLAIHTSAAPLNTTCEYASDDSSVHSLAAQQAVERAPERQQQQR
jgi:hypothetical protein